MNFRGFRRADLRALGRCSSAQQLKRSLVFRLEFPQPGLNSGEGDGDQDSADNSVGAVMRQTCEAPCVHIEASINLVAAHGTYKLQRSHRYPYTVYRNQVACVLARGRFPASLRSAAVISVRLKLALPISSPGSQRGFARGFQSWPSTDGFMALIEDFRLESSSPKQKLVSRPADADTRAQTCCAIHRAKMAQDCVTRVQVGSLTARAGGLACARV